MEFLEEKGALDDFIEAKLNGEEAAAKWYLLDSAKEEIEKIEEKLLRKRKEQEEDDKVEEAKRIKKVTGPPSPLNKNETQYVLGSSLTNAEKADKRNASLDRRVFDL